MAQIIAGNHGGRILVDQGYRYRYNRKRAAVIYWKCDVNGCPSNLKTSFFDIQVPNPTFNIINVTAHNGHLTADENIQRSIIIEQMRQEIICDP